MFSREPNAESIIFLQDFKRNMYRFPQGLRMHFAFVWTVITGHPVLPHACVCMPWHLSAGAWKQRRSVGVECRHWRKTPHQFRGENHRHRRTVVFWAIRVRVVAKISFPRRITDRKVSDFLSAFSRLISYVLIHRPTSVPSDSCVKKMDADLSPGTKKRCCFGANFKFRKSRTRFLLRYSRRYL